MTVAQLRASVLVTGVGVGSPSWDIAWREILVDNLTVLVGQLQAVGIARIFVDGSFVEDKDHPNDIDGYFECTTQQIASGDLARELNALDPHKVWTWDRASRRYDPNSAKPQLPMWHQYRVELYPHFGQPAGIVDRFGNELMFPAAFRVTRGSYTPKGIVQII